MYRRSQYLPSFARTLIGLCVISLCAVALLFVAGTATAQKFVEGTHYTRVTPAIATDAPEGKVEVREFFWYGCPHCYAIEPHLNAWKRSAPREAYFIRTPALLGEKWVAHAYTYYTLSELEMLDKMHPLFFKALHVDRLRLNTKSRIADFFGEHGIDPATFSGVYSSFSVKTRIKKAERLAMAYQIKGVPVLTVGGRYIVKMASIGSAQQLFDLLDHLVLKEHARMTRKK